MAGRPGGVVIHVQVRDVKHAAADRHRLWQSLAPIDRQLVRVLRAHIAVCARQVNYAVFVRRRGREAVDHRIHVSDRRGRAAGVRARVVIGQRHTDRVHVAGRPGGVVVQVLVRDVERTTCDRHSLRRTFAPVDRQRVRVLGTRVAVRTRQVNHAVLVHGRRRQCIDYRSSIRDRRARAVSVRTRVVVG